jgi:two-component system, cell cycle sensor histidine kinase and response regulator CckA
MEGRITSVLIVDDDTVIAKMAAEILGEVGHEVHIAHDGPTALALLEAHDIDVVLTDVVLGPVDGVELAESIAILRPRTVVIFMSGYGAHARGPARDDPVLTKPFSPKQLRDRVAAAIR